MHIDSAEGSSPFQKLLVIGSVVAFLVVYVRYRSAQGQPTHLKSEA